MRIDTEIVNAKDVPNDSFLFIPKENRFYLVDFAEVDGKHVNLHFEPDWNPNNWITIRYPIYKKVIVFNPKSLIHLPINRQST